MLLKNCQYISDVALEGTRKTAAGFMAADVRCARTGIQVYAGDELGRPDLKEVRVFRPSDEVFDAASLASYAFKPVTNDHPPELVTADNWKQYSVGSIGNEITKDGDFVRVPALMMDAAVVSDIESGKREISMGYTMDLDVTAGEHEGQAYDAVMRNLRMNHLAIVDKGRAGSSVRVGDSKSSWGDTPTTSNDGDDSMKLKTITFDGMSIETTDQGAQAVDKLQGKVDTLTADAATAKTANDTAIAAKDKELATKDAEIADLKKQVVDGAALDKLVSDHAALITKAKALVPDADFSGKTPVEIKAAVVDSAHGEGFSKDKSEAYVEGAFDALKAPTTAVDTVRTALSGGAQTTQATQAADNGQAEYEHNLAHAHLGDAAPKFNAGAA